MRSAGRLGGDVKRPVQGTIYLLHFSQRYRHAGHYLGWTSNLPKRLELHRSGQGARLLAVLAAIPTAWDVARTWEGTRTDERRLKNRKNAPRLCPLCQQSINKERASE